MNPKSQDFGTFKLSNGRALVSDLHLLELVRHEIALSRREPSAERLSVPVPVDHHLKQAAKQPSLR